jgi:prevent-host-death family protein
MDEIWSVQDAKNRFSEVVEAAREKPQTVTKHGKRAVVVMAADEYERLKKLERQKAITFKEHLLNMPKTMARLNTWKCGSAIRASNVFTRYECRIGATQAKMQSGRFQVVR